MKTSKAKSDKAQELARSKREGLTQINDTQLSNHIKEYLATCEANNLRPLKSELAYKLYIDAHRLTYGHSKTAHLNAAIKRLENANEAYLNRKLDSSAANQNAMFLLKVNHGYIEAQHVKVDLTSNGETLGVIQLPARKS